MSETRPGRVLKNQAFQQRALYCYIHLIIGADLEQLHAVVGLKAIVKETAGRAF